MNSTQSTEECKEIDFDDYLHPKELDWGFEKPVSVPYHTVYIFKKDGDEEDREDEFESDSEDEFESDSEDEFESDSEDEFKSDSEDEQNIYIVYGFYEPKGCQTHYRTFTDLNEAREYYNILINDLENECEDEVYLDELDGDGDIENLDCHRFERDSEDESE